MRVDSLPYVEATILELMRYKTVVPFSDLHCTLNDTEVGGYFVPGGTTVSWLIDYVWLRECVCENLPLYRMTENSATVLYWSERCHTHQSAYMHVELLNLGSALYITVFRRTSPDK